MNLSSWLQSCCKPLEVRFFNDHNAFRSALDGALQELGIKLTAASKKAIYKAASWANPEAAPVIKKVHRAGVKADPIRGLFEIEIDGKSRVVEYELDTDLRDTEQIPMLEDGGIEAFLAREVLPHAPGRYRHKVKIATRSVSPATSTSQAYAKS